MYEQTVVVNGVSKAYAMTGWRVGYLGGPLWIAKACAKLQGQMTTGATSVAQRAALAALEGDQQCVADMNDAFKRRRDLIMKRLNNIKGIKCMVPDGAFYVFPDMSYFYGKSAGDTKINDCMDLCLYLLAKGQIATVPGDAFGAPDNIRISFANSDENLVKAMDRLEKALAEIN